MLEYHVCEVCEHVCLYPVEGTCVICLINALNALLRGAEQTRAKLAEVTVVGRYGDPVYTDVYWNACDHVDAITTWLDQAKVIFEHERAAWARIGDTTDWPAFSTDVLPGVLAYGRAKTDSGHSYWNDHGSFITLERWD